MYLLQLDLQLSMLVEKNYTDFSNESTKKVNNTVDREKGELISIFPNTTALL
jgi:hypothetical protein